MRDKDKAKEYYKKYYAENKEKLKEKGRRYCSENKEKIKKYAKEYQQKNRENLCKKSREYQADNKEKLLTNNILNKEENKEELAKKKQVFLANYNQMVRKKLEKKCIKCEKEKPFNRFLVRELRSGNLAIRNVCRDCINLRNYYSQLTAEQKKIHHERAKQWAIEFVEEATRRGYKNGWDADYCLLGWLHDEWQVAVREEIAEEFGTMMVEAAAKAGEHFNFNIKIGAEYKVGSNWAECH